MANDMLAGGTRRIVRTGPLETNFITLPLDVVQRVWGFVAELERGTVEWLATRLQSIRRGLLMRRRLRKIAVYRQRVYEDWGILTPFYPHWLTTSNLVFPHM